MTAWAKQPIVHVANGVVRPDEEGGFRWELTEVERHIERFSNRSFGIGEERKREVAKRGFERGQSFWRTRADAHDGTADGCKQIVLLFEGEATAFAGRRIVSGVKEQDSPGAIKRGAVKGGTVICFKRKGRGWLTDEIDFHSDDLRQEGDGPCGRLWYGGNLGFGHMRPR